MTTHQRSPGKNPRGFLNSSGIPNGYMSVRSAQTREIPPLSFCSYSSEWLWVPKKVWSLWFLFYVSVRVLSLFLDMLRTQVWSSLDVRLFVDTRCDVIHAGYVWSTWFGIVSRIRRSPSVIFALSSVDTRCDVIHEIHVRSTGYGVVSRIRRSPGIVFTLSAIGYAMRGHTRDTRAEHGVRRSEQHTQEHETAYSSMLDDHNIIGIYYYWSMSRGDWY